MLVTLIFTAISSCHIVGCGRDVDADRDHADHAGLPGAIDHRSEISSKRLIIEMHVRVE